MNDISQKTIDETTKEDYLTQESYNSNYPFTSHNKSSPIV